MFVSVIICRLIFNFRDFCIFEYHKYINMNICQFRKKRWVENEKKLDFYSMSAVVLNKLFFTLFTFFCSNFQIKMSGKNGRFYSGVIEGFYNRPRSMNQRLDLFKKMNKFSLSSYLYAPKGISSFYVFSL